MSLPPTGPAALSLRHRARLAGWGRAVAGFSQVCAPESAEEIAAVLAVARSVGRSVGIRGAGRSYGDAALNTDGFVLDTRYLNRILEFDPATGVVLVEPGVTLEQLWHHTLPQGWWPPVVSGTMTPTLGGMVAANIHGKNNYQVGPIGEHVLGFQIVTPAGETLTCDRATNVDLFHAAIGGFGMLGVITELTLQLKRVYSGWLKVEAIPTRDLGEMLAIFAARSDSVDYQVGWIDCLAPGNKLGRGLIHVAWHLPPGADAAAAETLRVPQQDLPSRILGIIPKSLVHYPARFLVNNPGMRMLNSVKWHTSRWDLRGHRVAQSHAGFAFLLDYVPDWKLAYGPGGLIQYQVFVPQESAETVFGLILRRCQQAGLPSYLGVAKRHRPDAFLLSHAVDGYSLALDFKVTAANRRRLWALLQSLDGPVLEAGGRFYFAKDLTLQADRIPSIWPAATLHQLRALKNRHDPEHLLQTDLIRRLFPDLGTGAATLNPHGGDPPSGPRGLPGAPRTETSAATDPR